MVRVARIKITDLKETCKYNKLGQIRMTTIASVSICIRARIMVNYREKVEIIIFNDKKIDNMKIVEMLR